MSSSDRIRLLKAKTLARFHSINPQIPDMANRGQSAETLMLRKVGTENDCGVCSLPVVCLSVQDLSGCYGLPLSNNPSNTFYYLDAQDNLNSGGYTITIPPPPPSFPTDDSNYGQVIIVPQVINATSVAITSITDTSGTVDGLLYDLGYLYTTDPEPAFYNPIGVFVFWPSRTWDLSSLVVNVVASNACSSSSDEAEFGCFLAGSPVCMADGSFKPIEDVAVGDNVRGAFGEINTVMALHRPLLGAGSMVVINGEHSATAHHPHISVDRKFYLAEPDILSGFTYGKKHTVILADGTKEKRVMTGVNKERLLKLTTGVELQTNTGGRVVNTIDYKPMSPLTQVYHVVVSGSHTYIVEGYAVAGWCDERDFNYDTWSARI